MKNITVSLDDETYRIARNRAAAMGVSVSAMVKTYLAGLGAEDAVFQLVAAREHDLGGQIHVTDNSAGFQVYDREA
jgi:plasmid stability protein